MKRKVLCVTAIAAIAVCIAFAFHSCHQTAKNELDVQASTSEPVTVRDLACTLVIPDTRINGTVQQASNNDYYLRRDENGEPDIEGCYFADYECNMEAAKTLSRNTIIYGHTFNKNDKDRAFGQLRNYKDESYAKEHQYIQLQMHDGTAVFEFVSARIVETATSSDCILAEPDNATYQKILDMAMNDAVYSSGVEVTTNDKILTLSTCTGEKSTRLLITAKLVDIIT